MSFFGGGSKVSTPALQALAPTPTENSVVAKAEDTRRKMDERLGQRGTIHTLLGGPYESLSGTGLTDVGRSYS